MGAEALTAPSLNSPSARRVPDTLTEHAIEGGCTGVPHLVCNRLDRSALFQQDLRQAQAPLGQVVERRHSDAAVEMKGEARARHAGFAREALERPRFLRILMHRDHRFRQLRVSQASQNAAVHQLHLHRVAQDQQQQVFDQPVESRLLARAVLERSRSG